MPKIINARPEKIRLVVPVSKTRSILVSDDPQLVEDEGYAPGVMSALKKAWKKDDFFVCSLIDANGKVLDSVSGMAGYGGPLKAARAAYQDYFSSGVSDSEINPEVG